MSYSVKHDQTSPEIYDAFGRVISPSKQRASVPGLPKFWRSRSGFNLSPSDQISKYPYAYHSWTYAAINRVMTPLLGLPRILIVATDPNSDPLYEHEILNLLRQPNPFMCGTELWEATYLSMLLPTAHTPGGQCFWYLDSGIEGQPYIPQGKNLPAAIYPYSDNMIKPLKVRDKLGGEKHVGWKLEINGQTLEEFPIGAPNLIRIRFFNPYDPTKGLSPYSAALISVDQDLKADEFNTAFFDNYGAIGGLLQTDSEEITYAELQEYKEHFEEEYTGRHAAGRVAALAHGLKYEQFMRSNTDMQFMEQRKDNRLRIEAAYGVSDEEIGIYSSGMNRATAEQADRSVWQKTRLPLDRKVLSAINIRFIQYLEGGRFKLWSDLGKVEALRPDHSEKIQSMKVLVDCHIPPAEAARIVGLPLNTTDYPWLEKSFIASGLVDAELLAEVGALFASSQSEGADKKKLLSVVGKLLERRSDKIEISSADLREIERVSIADDSERRILLWEEYNREIFEEGIKSFRPKVERHWVTLRNEMLDKVDAWAAKNTAKSGPMNVRALAIDPAVFLFDLPEAQKIFLEMYGPEAEKQMKRELKDLKSRYGAVIEWAVNPENVDRAIKTRRNRIESIDTSRFRAARKQIGSIVKQGIEEMWTPTQMAVELKNGINDLHSTTLGQARTVARTEMGSISSWGRTDAFKASNIRRHEWLSAKDERVRGLNQEDRYNHAIDGERRSIGKLFTNGLIYPREPEGEAGNVINCRCVALAVIDD